MFNSGKGDVLLSYENEAIAAQQAGEDIDYVDPGPDHPDPEPGRGGQHLGNPPRRPRPTSTTPSRPDGQKIFGDNGYRPAEPGVAAQFDYPTPKQLFTIDDLGGWPKVKAKFFDPDNGSIDEDLPGPGYCHRVAASRRAMPRVPEPVTGRGRRRPARIGVGGPLHERDRAHPVRRAGERRVRQRVGRFWSAITNERAMAALKLTVGVSLVVVAINVVMGTIIAWVLVRDRFPGRAFVNSLIDLPFALPTIVAGVTLLAIYGPDSPVGVNLAFTRAGVCVALLLVTLPFVVRSRAAGAAGARPRRWRRRPPRWAPRRWHDVPARSSCPTSCPRSSAAPAWPSPARWASSARWC